MQNARLARSDQDRRLAGVCGGIATYLSIDPMLVRIAFLILAFASGIGLPIYFILWVIMPNEADVDQPGKIVLHDNFEDMGKTVTTGVNRLSKPGTIGTVLIALGGYFLLAELGILAGISSGVIWSILIIGAGAYWLSQSKKSS